MYILVQVMYALSVSSIKTSQQKPTNFQPIADIAISKHPLLFY